MRRIGAWVVLATIGVLLVGAGAASAAKGGNGKGGGGDGDDGGGTSTASPAIAWVQIEKKTWNLKVMDADGANVTTVVKDVGTSFAAPDWSPDGTELVFVARDRLQGTGIYRVPIDGTSAPTKIVTSHSSAAPKWSPTTAPDEKTWIAYQEFKTVGYGMDIVVVSPSGGTPVSLTGHLAGHFQYPCWSGDATRIAAAMRHTKANGDVRNDLVVLELTTDSATGALKVDSVLNLTDVEDSPLRSLADDSIAVDQDYEASWGRTGDTLLVRVVHNVSDKDNYDLWEISIDAPESPTRWTNTTASVDGSHTVGELHPSYAPDDSKAVFHLRGKGNSGSGIFTIVLSGTAAGTIRPLLVSSDARRPTWFRGTE